MKGILVLELFGEDTRHLLKLYRMEFEAFMGDLGRQYFDQSIGMIPRSSWVAEICGPDEKYRLSRKFLRGKTDYSRSNSKGSRGIFVEYILSPGKIYEVRDQVSWKNANQYFCTVNDAGDIIELPEESVCHSMGALTREEAAACKRIMIAEIVGPDDRYFFERKFLGCSFKYSKDTDNGRYPGYTLSKGHIYEITEFSPRGGRRRHYCVVDDEQGLIKLSEDDVCRAVGALTREEWREKKRVEKSSRYQRPGRGQGSDQQDL